MPQITLPNGQVKSYDSPVNLLEIAHSISPNLAKITVAGLINGELVDTRHIVDEDASIRLITTNDEEALKILRNSTNYLLAYAVHSLYPEIKLAGSQITEEGFYYDFSYSENFNPDMLDAIEQQMYTLVERKQPIELHVWNKEEVIAYFNAKRESYKLALLENTEKTTFTLYQIGDFIDITDTPIVSNTGNLIAFQLMNVSGAYWKGNSENEMLQRVTGTAWRTKKELKTYLSNLEEAEKRDHRKLGKELDLFHIQEEAPGMIFWHDKGWQIWQGIEQFLRKTLSQSGYNEVKTPIIMDRSLWERSGHWDNYQENMFITESEKRVYAIKPMNCPLHIEIFKRKIHSYRDLPLRLAEFGSCHRNEFSGALHGLMRVRGFVQDDAHIFCTEEQVESEVKRFHELLVGIYQVFGFNDIDVKLSLRPEKKAGSDETWDRAEEGLRRALRSGGVSWTELPGEGAFYGPKVEYHIRDAIGRSWQCGTVQLDFVLPDKLGAEYVTEHNEKATPVLLHRAVIGSFERFIAILIEHYAGQFPVWLSPVQVSILTITDKQEAYCKELATYLGEAGIRCITDTRNEKISFKIREHHLQKVPYIVIVGDKEKEEGSVAVRHRQDNLGSMSKESLRERLLQEVTSFH